VLFARAKQIHPDDDLDLDESTSRFRGHPDDYEKAEGEEEGARL